MRTSNTAKTGNAQIQRLGHTSSPKAGTNIHAVATDRAPRDEVVK